MSIHLSIDISLPVSVVVRPFVIMYINDCYDVGRSKFRVV